MLRFNLSSHIFNSILPLSPIGSDVCVCSSLINNQFIIYNLGLLSPFLQIIASLVINFWIPSIRVVLSFSIYNATLVSRDIGLYYIQSVLFVLAWILYLLSLHLGGKYCNQYHYAIFDGLIIHYAISDGQCNS